MAVAGTAPSLTGARKVAVAMMMLGEEVSSSVFKHLSEDEIERVAREIASMSNVPADLSEQVLTELHDTARAASSYATGGVEQARRLLMKSLSPEDARRILDRIVHMFNTTVGFQSLEKANPEQLSKFILGEHPQTTALILAHLNPGSAAELLGQIPDEIRAEVVMRMATLGEISPEVVARVSTVIEQRLRGLGGPRRQQRGGVRAVAELFNRLDRAMSRPALERIEALSPDLATAIKNLMFTFDDLAHIDDTGIREITNRADKKTLTLALKGATDEIKTRFFSNMSKRAGDLMKEEIEMLGAVRLKEVEKAQHEIVAVARKLEEEGVITTSAGAGEQYVT